MMHRILILLAVLASALTGRVAAATASACPGCKPSAGVALRWEGSAPERPGQEALLELVVTASRAGAHLRLRFDVPEAAALLGSSPEFDAALPEGELRFPVRVRGPRSGAAVLAARGEVVSLDGVAYRVGASVRLGPGARLAEPPAPSLVALSEGAGLLYQGAPRRAGDRLERIRDEARPVGSGRVSHGSAAAPRQGPFAEGAFYYRDRTFDENGFLVSDPAQDRLLPVRRAEVEILQNGVVAATGVTGEDGTFSIPVSSTTGSFRARVKSRTLPAMLPEVRVFDTVNARNLYVAQSSALSSPGGDAVALGETVIEAGAGGEAFNILDACLEASDLVAALQGAQPANNLSVYWTITSGIGTYYNAAQRGIFLLDEEGYDDCVIIHEYGHHAASQYSRDNSPGGVHYIDQSTQDPLLSWSEGWASFWQSAVRSFRVDDPIPSWYVDNAIDGSLLFSYESEGPGPDVAGLGSEVAVQAALWDLLDAASTPDPVPGTDDDPLAVDPSEIWEVFAGPMKSAILVTMEDFWAGWFDPSVANGLLPEMEAVFTTLGMEFTPDLYEPDGMEALASPLALDGTPVRHTFYPAPDVDVHLLELLAGDEITVETLNLSGYGDTFLEVFDPSANKIAFNDNAPAFNPAARWTGLASSVSFLAPVSGAYPVRISRAYNGYAGFVAGGAYTVRALRGRPSAVTFASAGSSAGVASSSFSVGAAFADYDLDGAPDLVVVNNAAGGPSAGSDLLFRNLGNGSFQERSQAAGFSVGEGGVAAAWGDMDNDGDPDLFLTDHALYRNNGDGTFEEVSAAAGIPDLGREFDAAWVDYDGDGRLDLFVAVRNAPSALWRNQGDGTFTNVAAEAGFGFPADGGEAYGCAWADYDGDRRPDLFLAFLSGRGHGLYRNLGDGTFAEVTAEAGLASSDPAVGASWGDVDNDGRLDLFVASSRANKLYRNDGDGTFTEVAAAWGVDDPAPTRGSGFADYDLDGDLDLWTVNFDPQGVLYENLGGRMVRTTRTAPGQGLAHAGAWADYDGDGDPDFYVARQGDVNLLFRNDAQDTGETKPHLSVVLRGVVSNRDGIGAVIRAYGGGRLQTREVGTGTGWAAKSRLPELFGLPAGASFDSVRVDWPSGAYNVAVPQPGATSILVVEDQSTPVLPPGAPPPMLTAGPAFPNPFAGATTLLFTLGQDARVRAVIYDVSGRPVRTLLDAPLPAGEHVLGWDGQDTWGRYAAPGVYFYRLQAGERTELRKIVRIAR